MKFSASINFFARLLLLAFLSHSCGNDEWEGQAAQSENQFTKADTSSYSFGFLLATQIAEAGLNFERESFLKGMEDGEKGIGGLFPDSVLSLNSGFFSHQLREGYFQNLLVKAATNLEKANIFLAENLNKEGVQLHPLGIQYKVINAGTGKLGFGAKAFRVHFQAGELDAPFFADSRLNGAPEIWDAGGLIVGLKIALSTMKEGSLWELWIPPDRAYGEKGLPSQVGPNALIHAFLEFINVEESTERVFMDTATLNLPILRDAQGLNSLDPQDQTRPVNPQSTPNPTRSDSPRPNLPRPQQNVDTVRPN